MTSHSCLTIAGRPVRSWMVTAALAAISIAYALFVFAPRQRAISQLRTELNEQQQHVVQADLLAMPIRQAQLRLTSTRAFSSDWHEAAPRAGQLVSVFARLAEQAKLAGVTVQRFDPLPAVDMQTVSQHNVVMSLSGSFPQAFDYLQRIETLPQTIWIRDLRLLGGNQETNELQIEVTLTIFSDRTGNTD